MSDKKLLYKVTLARPIDRGASEYVVSMKESDAARVEVTIDRSKADGILDYGTVEEIGDALLLKTFREILEENYEIHWVGGGPKDWHP